MYKRPVNLSQIPHQLVGPIPSQQFPIMLASCNFPCQPRVLPLTGTIPYLAQEIVSFCKLSCLACSWRTKRIKAAPYYYDYYHHIFTFIDEPPE